MTARALTDEQIFRARDLRASDPGFWRYPRLAKYFGVSVSSVYHAVNGYRPGGAGVKAFAKEDIGRPPISNDDLRRRLAEIPPDTRNRWQQHFDEPLPGRSALDQKRREMTA